MKYIIILVLLTGCFAPKEEEEWVTVIQDNNEIKNDASRPENSSPYIIEDGFGGDVFFKNEGEEDEENN